LVSIPANIFAEVTTADFSQLFVNQEIYETAFTIGLLASLETLLCMEQ
jgi:hypothetical protein